MVATRSLSLRKGDKSSSDTARQASYRIPPPPPPRTSQFGWRSEGEEEDSGKRRNPIHQEEEDDLMQHETGPLIDQEREMLEEHQYATEAREYLLTVKCPPFHRTRNPSDKDNFDFIHPSRRIDVVRVQMYPGMTSDVLAECTTQAVSQFMPMNSSPALLVGLFGENDRIFHSFQHILSSADPSWQAYCTILPPPPVVHEEPSPCISAWILFGVASITLLFVYVWFYIGGTPQMKYYLGMTTVLAQERVSGLCSAVHEWVFNLPFRELYRNGPHWIGWEGLPLAEVCNRITHFGGRDFWRRNMSECEEIYFGKEEAFARTLRPLAYTILCIVIFYVVQSLVVSYGESKRNRTDRSVLEAYHAFQTLVRIANRQDGGGNHVTTRRGH